MLYTIKQYSVSLEQNVKIFRVRKQLLILYFNYYYTFMLYTYSDITQIRYLEQYKEEEKKSKKIALFS